ncbi:hypothetical protein [Parendozoicomonas haliclonae]|uniref:Uncharacterized protein n=1 Tax=Parendozoicomonas haliclonae TaxID=1960125 RepID=A0A1X7AS50_9GAMM|nr:hypothetical protein [Parendozoicomonas haliclonae]SMA50972.1 hypothetical protein EHSB41UT_04793 [Parendozoicomonas haliclonae]
MMNNNNLSDKIEKVLIVKKDISAREIAEILNADKSTINRILYKDDRFVSLGSTPPRWKVKAVIPVYKEKEEYKQLDKWEGIPGYLGYKVGVSGKFARQRRDILDRIMTRDLPKVHSKEYMDEWGEINSQVRLQRLAGHLTVQHNTRKSSTFKTARTEWKLDLEYLKEKYHDGSWGWPRLTNTD